MKYFVSYDSKGNLIALTQGYGQLEITEDEYRRLDAEIDKKIAYTNAVYADPAKIDAVPPEWRGEVLRRVEERRQAEQEAQNADVSPEELGRMMMEVL